MQQHKVQLRGTETWDGGGWGRRATTRVVRATTRVAPTRVADLFNGVVGRLGLEPRTNGLKARCSTN